MTKGERIKELRQKLGISQTDLAKKIGISKQTLYKYENDIVTNIPSDKIELLSSALQTTPEYIMGWEKEFNISVDKSYEYATLKIALSDPRFQKIVLDYFEMEQDQKELFCDFYEKFIEKKD